MDINHIKLPASVVADLYHSSLIEADEKPVDQVTEVHDENKPAGLPVWKWLGENNKNILVIVSYPDAVHLPDNELAFLTGILGCLQIEFG